MNVIDKSIHADQQKAISNQLAVFALELTFDAIPEKIRERSKYLMLDAIGIAYASQGFHFAGATMAAAQIVRNTRWRRNCTRSPVATIAASPESNNAMPAPPTTRSRLNSPAIRLPASAGAMAKK